MSIKITDTRPSSCTISYPFIWCSPNGVVYIRRADGVDARLETGDISEAVTPKAEAWARRLSQVTLTSGGDA